MNHIRAHIRLMNNQEAVEFVGLLNSDGTATKYSLENFDGSYRVNARSFLGVVYFCTEHNDDTYLVNDTDTQELPNCINKFRV